MEAAEFPACEDQTTILAEMIKFYLACGNGFLIKMRNPQGDWMGLERMLPSEVQIVENYDKFSQGALSGGTGHSHSRQPVPYLS
jgi:capsid portal protein